MATGYLDRRRGLTEKDDDSELLIVNAASERVDAVSSRLNLGFRNLGLDDAIAGESLLNDRFFTSETSGRLRWRTLYIEHGVVKVSFMI